MGFLTGRHGEPITISNLSARFGSSALWELVAGVGTGSPASAAWISANRALYFPLVLPFAYPVKRAWWSNGGTANGTVDLGIFSADGKKLYSTGATTQSGTSAIQYAAVDWLIQPGEYYLALSLSSGTGTIQRSTNITAVALRLTGILREDSAHPLPATMTPAAMASAYVPLFGLTRMSSY
jgi:hypothetical protein